MGERPAIHGPADAAALVQYDMSALEQEELWVLLLDTRNRLLGIDHLYKGSLNSSQVRLGEVFKSAVRQNAAAVIYPIGWNCASSIPANRMAQPSN